MAGMTRRTFLAATLTAPAAGRAPARARADITVGITVDTRPDWNGPANFIRSIDEASSVGYRWIETFWQYVDKWESQPQGLKDELERRQLRLETVSNGGRMRMNFVDPRERAGTIEDHVQLLRFIRWFDCDHLKINCGSRPADMTARRADYCREMATTFVEIGKRAADMGLTFGVHAHLNSAFEFQEEVDRIMDLTDPRYVYFICDTGHVTMAGMDPVALTRTYSARIIEYHIKDTAPDTRGGFKGTLKPPYNTGPDNLIFFEPGKGGVDFPAIKTILDERGWKGWWTVELDRTSTTARQSCAIAKRYLEDVINLKIAAASR
jgi:inosose dehydratase